MTIIVTGSLGLIGTEVTRYLQTQGHRVIEFDVLLGHNLCDEETVKELFKVKADALVNLFALNDHISSSRFGGKLMDVPISSIQDYLAVNVTALFSVCREFARNNETGTIVNFSSTYGLGSPNPKLYPDSEKHIGYGVSKAAVIQLTKHLAVHLAPEFRVNCIAPGGVRLNQGKEFQEAYSALTPLGRMAEIGEINAMVEFLISERSSYCTGGVYCVDGGWTAW